MDPYRTFALLRVNELTIIRHGFLKPWYEMTDGQFCYGKLKYTSWMRRCAWLETFDGSWRLKPKGILSRSQFIMSGDESVIGEIKQKWLSCKTQISFNNGFAAVFGHKKIFTKKYTLSNDQFGDILKVDQKIFKFKRPFTVTFEQNLLKSIPDMPLLMLLGVRLALLHQEEAAAAASH